MIGVSHIRFRQGEGSSRVSGARDVQLRFAPNSPCYVGYIGIMEKKMETTIVYRDYIEIMEKKMETTIMGYMSSYSGVGCICCLNLAGFGSCRRFIAKALMDTTITTAPQWPINSYTRTP